MHATMAQAPTSSITLATASMAFDGSRLDSVEARFRIDANFTYKRTCDASLDFLSCASVDSPCYTRTDRNLFVEDNSRNRVIKYVWDI